VGVGGLEGFHHVLRIVIDRAGDEGGLGAEREKQRVERMSIEPVGVVLVLVPTGEVGLYCPLVRP
jgi:hypothetical protein